MAFLDLAAFLAFVGAETHKIHFRSGFTRSERSQPLKAPAHGDQRAAGCELYVLNDTFPAKSH